MSWFESKWTSAKLKILSEDFCVKSIIYGLRTALFHVNMKVGGKKNCPIFFLRNTSRLQCNENWTLYFYMQMLSSIHYKMFFSFYTCNCIVVYYMCNTFGLHLKMYQNWKCLIFRPFRKGFFKHSLTLLVPIRNSRFVFLYYMHVVWACIVIFFLVFLWMSTFSFSFDVCPDPPYFFLDHAFH